MACITKWFWVLFFIMCKYLWERWRLNNKICVTLWSLDHFKAWLFNPHTKFVTSTSHIPMVKIIKQNCIIILLFRIYNFLCFSNSHRTSCDRFWWTNFFFSFFFWFYWIDIMPCFWNVVVCFYCCSKQEFETHGKKHHIWIMFQKTVFLCLRLSTDLSDVCKETLNQK